MSGRRKQPKSIMPTEKGVCFLCRTEGQTELHHIFFGPGLRKISDKNGLVVYLCHECHQGTAGIHGRDGSSKNHDLKQMAQFIYEKKHSREEWMKLIGRNYL